MSCPHHSYYSISTGSWELGVALIMLNWLSKEKHCKGRDNKFLGKVLSVSKLLFHLFSITSEWDTDDQMLPIDRRITAVQCLCDVSVIVILCCIFRWMSRALLWKWTVYPGSKWLALCVPGGLEWDRLQCCHGNALWRQLGQ